MNAPQQVPSGVLISTSVSTISMPMSAAAVDDDDTDAAMPAPTKRVVKSRRVRSPGFGWLLVWFFSSVVMVFRAKSLSHFAGRPHRRIIRALGVARSLAFLGAGAGPPGSSGSAALFLQKTARSRPSPVIPEIVTRFNCLIAVGQTTIRCRRLYLPPESLPDPSRWALVPYAKGNRCRKHFDSSGL